MIIYNVSIIQQKTYGNFHIQNTYLDRFHCISLKTTFKCYNSPLFYVERKSVLKDHLKMLPPVFTLFLIANMIPQDRF
jgi:hypothetical protein